MEKVLEPIYREHMNDLNTLGILIMEKEKSNSTITDDFDVILLIIVKEANRAWHVDHYEFANKTAALHIVTEDVLREWIDTSGYRKAVEWIIYGKTIFDQNEFIIGLKDELRDFPHVKRDLRKIIEFGKLVKSFSEVKNFYESDQYKDASSNIVKSLHYLARLAVIEKGYYPEVTVWIQVKQIDIEVYKLYEEFFENNEEIDKRIQLMIIAMDFVISNRVAGSVNHLFNIMQTKDVWSYSELKLSPHIKPYTLDLTAIISYLVGKGIIETVQLETREVGIYQRKYRFKSDR